MTAVDFVVPPPPGQAYTFENLRSQVGQEVGVLVEDEGVERATLLAVNPTSGGGAWDVRLTFELAWSSLRASRPERSARCRESVGG